MKATIFILTIFSSCQIISQQKNDITEIISLVVNNYKKDTLEVYNRFHNNELIKDFEDAETVKFFETNKKIENRIKGTEFKDVEEKEKLLIHLDLLWENMHTDSVTLSFQKIKVLINETTTLINKKNNKRINRYAKSNLTRKKKKKYAFISFPIISSDKSKAIVYVGYYCGGLCGSGGILHLEKKNGTWQILEFEPTWIA